MATRGQSWFDRLRLIARSQGWAAAVDAALTPGTEGFGPGQSIEWLTGREYGLVRGCHEAVQRGDGLRLATWAHGCGTDAGPGLVAIPALLADAGETVKAARVEAVLAAAEAVRLCRAGQAAGGGEPPCPAHAAELLWVAAARYSGAAPALVPAPPPDATGPDAVLRWVEQQRPDWFVGPVAGLVRFLAGRGWPTRVGCSIEVPVALVHSRSGHGQAAVVSLRRVAEGSGRLLPDPETMFFVPVDDEFCRSLHNARSFARERLWTDSTDVYLRLLDWENGLPLGVPVKGPSLGGALGLGLTYLFQPRLGKPLPGVAISAELQPDGTLAAVHGEVAKLEALRQLSRTRLRRVRHVILPATAPGRPAVEGVAVHTAPSVADAVRIVGGVRRRQRLCRVAWGGLALLAASGLATGLLRGRSEAAPVVVLQENWDGDTYRQRWEFGGDPVPYVAVGKGVGGSRALASNGDGSYGTWASSRASFDWQGHDLSVAADLRYDRPESTSVHQHVRMGLITTDRDAPRELAAVGVFAGCAGNERQSIAYFVADRIVKTEPLSTVPAGRFTRFAIRLRADGSVSFFRNGEHVETVLRVFGERPPLRLALSGQAVGMHSYCDDVEVLQRKAAGPDEQHPQRPPLRLDDALLRALAPPGWKVLQTLEVPNARVNLDALDRAMGGSSQRVAGMVRWSRPAAAYALTATPGGKPQQPLADSLQIVFAVSDTAQFVGAVAGADDAALALLAPAFGYGGNGQWVFPGVTGFGEAGPFMTTLFSMIWAEYAKLKWLPLVVEGGPAPSWCYDQGDIRAVYRSSRSQVVTCFPQPVWVVFTGLMRWAVDEREKGDVGERWLHGYWGAAFDRWYPRGRPFPGSVSRHVGFSFDAPTASWFHALVELDNGNAGEVILDETETLAQHRNHGATYAWRQNRWPQSLSLSGSTRWSAFGVVFGGAFLADRVTFPELRESPGTGPCPNPEPLVYVIPAGRVAPGDG